jgi:hypothetical protein
MTTIKQLFKATLFAGLAITAVSCSKDKTGDTNITGDKVYALGLGVTTTAATTNYVLATSNLMTGTISLTNNGVLQSGYRDYAFGGSTFFSIGGLGVTDVNAIKLDASNKLTTRTGLTFDAAAVDFKDVDGTGKTMLGVSVPASPTAGLSASFFTVDIASNTVSAKTSVLMNSIHPSSRDWFLHTGIEVRGSQAFQTFYPINYSTYVTTNTDTAYVAIYSYPGFVLQKVIKDARTGPAGSFGTQSGIFRTESGDLYTVAHNGFGYSKSTKAAGILKIAAGATEFDQSYYFNTATATNGGKIVHAKYIGNNKLFAEITTMSNEGNQWIDGGLKFAIVDLAAKTITAVTNSPTFVGNGGRSFAAVLDEGKVYVAATVNNVTNIYQVDVATATSTKGAVIDATFLGGIARLK